jgi:hypothetical protein
MGESENRPTTNGPDLYAQVCYRIRESMGEFNDSNLPLEVLVASLADKARAYAALLERQASADSSDNCKFPFCNCATINSALSCAVRRRTVSNPPAQASAVPDGYALARHDEVVNVLKSQSKYLRNLAEEIRRGNHNGWGNTAEQAANSIEAVLPMIAAPQPPTVQPFDLQAVREVPDGWVKPSEVESYYRAIAKPRGLSGGAQGVHVADVPTDLYTMPIYFASLHAPDGES